ncbi:hypothetical protein L226DRAFT_613587, partial [Lentinus tigrinus ALCF2SS1-7]|uniref:uncharacterized protein n=1 Tax=Lentinus tigrinus ALCF2SS1-7 TaxID=1328758 RepID=UPI0011660863
MSSTPDLSVVELASIFDNLVINNRCGFAALTLLCSEYLAHFTQDVDLFWTREVTEASILFLSNRYLPLLSTITQCHDRALSIAMVVFGVLQYLPWAAFSSLRTYALCGRHRLAVATIVFLLSSVPIGINFLHHCPSTALSTGSWFIGGSGEEMSVQDITPRHDCELDANHILIVTIASRVYLIAADLVVLVVTWWATYYGTGLRAIQPHCRPSFSHILLRDGMMYFLVLLTLNILHLLFTLLSISSESLVPVSYITIFTEPYVCSFNSRFVLPQAFTLYNITAILISRFIINLQEVNRGINYWQAESSALATASQSTINFAKVIGPLGSSLGLSDHGTETDVGGVENERAIGMDIETISRV